MPEVLEMKKFKFIVSVSTLEIVEAYNLKEARYQINKLIEEGYYGDEGSISFRHHKEGV